MRETDRIQRLRVLVCAALAALALLAGIAVALSHAAPRRAGSNGAPIEQRIGEAPSGSTLCQPGEVLPAGTASLRPLAAPTTEAVGPRLLVTLRRHGQLLRRSTAARGWRSEQLVVPIERTVRDYDDVEVCIRAGSEGGVAFEGYDTAPGGAGAVLDGEATGRTLRIDYFRPGRETWWSYAPTIVRRIGYGRGGWGGSWIAGLIAALTLASIVLAALVVLRTIAADAAPRRRRATAWTLATIGFLNAAAWSLISPPLLIPDEIGHVAYAQQIGETGRPPAPGSAVGYPADVETLAAQSLSGTYRTNLWRRRLFTRVEERRVERAVRGPFPPGARRGDARDVDPEPPLYYALEAIPYRLAHGATLPQRIAAMRLLSALMAAATVAFVFLFLRACLPACPWAWSVGALGAAFLPMVGFISGGVNPDALLFAVCAALFYCLARAFRSGLTTRLALWTGAVFGIGLIAKINFYGLAPGAAVAIVLAARHTEGRWSARVLGRSALALGVGLAPYALVSLLEAAAWDRSFLIVHRAAAEHEDHGGLLEQLGFLWQVYLPRLPGQTPAFDGYLGWRVWFWSFMGNFSWLSIPFPSWAYGVALAVLSAIGVLAARALVSARGVLRRRGAELAGYALMTAGLLALIAMVALRGFAPSIDAAAQGRYLLPLLALFAALLALGARGAGATWGRAVGATIVVGFVGWSVFAQLVAIAGYYG
jgi:Predicted membrane protein (DUF2142)